MQFTPEFFYTDAQARAVSDNSDAMIEALKKVYNAGWLAEELMKASV